MTRKRTWKSHRLPLGMLLADALHLARRKVQHGGDGVEHVRLRGRIGPQEELQQHILQVLEVGALATPVALQAVDLVAQSVPLFGRAHVDGHRRHLHIPIPIPFIDSPVLPLIELTQ